jgi:hypothetical protein
MPKELSYANQHALHASALDAFKAARPDAEIARA